MAQEMEALFGELRGLLGARFGGQSAFDALDPRPSVERRRRARRKSIVATLEQAHALDPRRYEEEWLPYLRRAPLPVFTTRSLGQIHAWSAFMPADVFDIGCVFRVGEHNCEAFAKNAHLAHVTHLYLQQEHDRSRARPLKKILASPHLVNLRRVSLQAFDDTYGRVATSSGDAVLRGLAASVSVRGLEALEFRAFPFTRKAWDVFLASEAARTLRALSLRGPFGASSVSEGPSRIALAALEAHDVGLRSLSLDRCAFTRADAEWVSRAALDTLELLLLDGDDGLKALARSTSPRPLRRFAAHLDGAVADALFRSPLLSAAEGVELDLTEWKPKMSAGALLRYLEVAPPWHVEALNLTSFGAADVQTLEALTGWAGLSRTTSLSIWGATFDMASLITLLDSPHAAHIESLDLTNSPLTLESVEALAEAAALTRLTSLNLNGCIGDEDAALVLAASPNLGGLERLEVRGEGFTARALSALRAGYPPRRLEVLSGAW